MERYFCVGLEPLVALMAADREAAEERSHEPARPPSPVEAARTDRSVKEAYPAHS